MVKKTACTLSCLIAMTVALLIGQQRSAHAGEPVADAWMKTKAGCRVLTPDSLSNTLAKAKEKTVTWTGHCKNGYAEGEGVMTWLGSGETYGSYEGNWVAGKQSGRGKMYIVDGMYYDGSFTEGKYNGNGAIYYYADGTRYEGNWVAGVRSGKGKMYLKNGNLLYDGEWRNDEWNGRGEMYYGENVHGAREVGYWVNYNHQDGTIEYDDYGSPIRILSGGQFVGYSPDAQQTQSNDVADSGSDDSADSNSHVGLQILGAALSTVIQARGMKDAAASQRAYQAAANQQARINATAVAQASLAAAQAQQAQAQARHEEQVAAAQAQVAAVQAQAAAQASAVNAAASHPKPAYAPGSTQAQGGYTQTASSTPSGPPSFTTSDQQHCDNSDDPLSCTYNVLVSNHGNRGINCTADVTLYRTNSVTGDTDQLSARDVGYVPANSTSTVSSNLAKGGTYNVNCSY